MVKNIDSKSDQTMIATGVQVKGNLKCQNDLWFDGLIAGDIEASGNVTIGPNAAVTGNVSGNNLNVAGQVHGNLNVGDGLSLASTAIVQGDIKTKQLEVAGGATISGHLRMEPAEPMGDHA